MARGDGHWVRTIALKSLVTATLVAGGSGVVLVFLARFLIHLWVGSLIQPSTSLLIGLALWLLLSTLGNVVAMLLIALRQLKLQVVLACLMAVANVFLSVYLARRMGVAGLIWGTVISYVVFAVVPYAFILPRLLRKHCPAASGLAT